MDKGRETMHACAQWFRNTSLRGKKTKDKQTATAKFYLLVKRKIPIFLSRYTPVALSGAMLLLMVAVGDMSCAEIFSAMFSPFFSSRQSLCGDDAFVVGWAQNQTLDVAKWSLKTNCYISMMYMIDGRKKAKFWNVQ
jgi:hypothetical protein